MQSRQLMLASSLATRWMVFSQGADGCGLPLYTVCSHHIACHYHISKIFFSIVQNTKQINIFLYEQHGGLFLEQ